LFGSLALTRFVWQIDVNLKDLILAELMIEFGVDLVGVDP
jgi:hypothetical protein